MKTNQLRIGNYVWDDYSGEMIVSEIHFNPEQEKGLDSVLLRKNMNLPSGRYICSQINPIPLTEEWLNKFGWEWSIFHQAFHKEGFSLDLTCLIDGLYTMSTFKKGLTIVAAIDSVHQLQNIYFALTGVELKT
jgi:hypothetical protein